MTVCLGRPDAVPYFDMVIYSSTIQVADHPGLVPQDHMGRYPPEVWRLVQSLASRMEAASSSPAGNGIDQGRGQWEGAHHAPREILNVSQGRRGAQNVPQGRSGFQDRRGPQGRGRAQNALTRDTPRRERRGRVGRGRSGRR